MPIFARGKRFGLDVQESTLVECCQIGEITRFMKPINFLHHNFPKSGILIKTSIFDSSSKSTNGSNLYKDNNTILRWSVYLLKKDTETVTVKIILYKF